MTPQINPPVKENQVQQFLVALAQILKPITYFRKTLILFIYQFVELDYACLSHSSKSLNKLYNSKKKFLNK